MQSPDRTTRSPLGGPAYARGVARIDVEALKQAHPIQEVLARYGIELRRQGRAAVGRCPLHPDRGRPNLHVWTDTSSWWCFRCNVGGDTIRFVELVEGVAFREALERLGASGSGGRQVARPAVTAPASPAHPIRRTTSCEQRDAEELAVLGAATWLYHQRLLTDANALAYLEQRGLDRDIIVDCRIGFAAGDELMSLLRWQRLPLGPALRVGLLTHTGREFLANRIVVPELRHGQPVWLVGRLLNGATVASGGPADPPKYLTLPGSKPLLGLEQARESPSVIATEGVFDLLTLRRWGYPCVALVGTHTRPDIVEQLRAFQRVYLVLDQDDAGTQATSRLADALGAVAVPVALPRGVKDIAELAPRTDGKVVFAAALLEAVGALKPSEEPSDRVRMS